MDGGLYDLGDGLYRLVGFGPPEVATLADFVGNASVTEKASGFWEVLEAVSFHYVAAAGAANRLPRLRWFEGESVAFAAAIAQAPITAGLTVDVTFAAGVQAGGAIASGAILAPMPRLVILPGWTVQLDVPGGLVGDAISNVRLYRRRLRPVEVAAFERE
jgi:hypothetical protein